jgi:signal transduction histidine kinase
MAVETKLRELALQAQNLLLCDGACIIPGCPDQALAHALLARWSHDHAPESTFSPLTSPYLYRSTANEHVRALCDIALETGTTQSIESLPLFPHQSSSVVACPLMLPAGRLGVLLAFYLRPFAFRSGDHALLEQYSVYLARQLEQLATDEIQDERNAVLPVQRTLVSVMGHELRAPLAIIKGYASLLRSYDGSEEQMTPIPIQLRQRYLDAIIEQTDHMTALVQDMLNVARLQRGELKFHPTRIDLGRLCKRVVEQMQARADQQQSGKYQLRCRLDTHIPILQIDPVRIRQILVNLLENAIKYSPDGGAIEVDVSLHLPTHSQGGEICIAVQDWGIGIPLPQQEMVFRPFVRLEHPLTRYAPGHGLGLSVSRYLAEAMGGSLTLTSGGRQQGTCVILTVPLMPENKPSATCEIQPSLL